MLKEQIKQATIRHFASEKGLNHSELASQHSSRNGMVVSLLLSDHEEDTKQISTWRTRI